MARLYWDDSNQCFIDDPSLKPKKIKEKQRIRIETDYIERSIPKHLIKKADKLIDAFLVSNGYDPEGEWYK